MVFFNVLKEIIKQTSLCKKLQVEIQLIRKYTEYLLYLNLVSGAVENCVRSIQLTLGRDNGSLRQKSLQVSKECGRVGRLNKKA